MGKVSREALQPGGVRFVGALFVVGGAALVVHIAVGLPLWVTVPAGVGLVAAVLHKVGVLHQGLRHRSVRAGAVAGMAATATYDAVRLAVSALLPAAPHPFEAWRLFGQALVGDAAGATTQWIAGACFHVANGFAFAIAYTIWFGGRGTLAGVAWGLFLEAFMLGLYPGWLDIAAYRPFLAVSLAGHVGYGAVLGYVAQRRLATGVGRG